MIYIYIIHIFTHFPMSNHIFQLYFPTRCSNHFLTISTGGQMTPPWHCAWQIPCWSVKAVLENDAPWGKGKSSMVLKIRVTLDVCITVYTYTYYNKHYFLKVLCQPNGRYLYMVNSCQIVTTYFLV